MTKFGRSDSCPVAVPDTNPDSRSRVLLPVLSNQFELRSPVPDEDQVLENRTRSWSKTVSYKVLGWSSSLHRTISQPSSHYCDLHDDLPDDDGESYFSGELETVAESPLDAQQFQDPKKTPKKPKPRSRLSVMLLDQGLFTVYKRLFVATLAVNVLVLALSANNKSPYAKKRAAMFAICNIFALTLCRSEAVLRVVFWLVVKLLGRAFVPLRVKTATTAFLQCLGGVHSGCGVSSVAWLIYALVLTLHDRDNSSTEIMSAASAILGLVMLTALAAFPLVRHLHHNVFERTHRFAGWTALGLLWVFVVLTECYEPVSKSYDFMVSKLLKDQEFWFTLAITALIVLPWITMRRVAVNVSAASGHASLIKFEGGIQAGILGRISPSPLSEWHAFGIISDGKNGHMVLAGAVGDFTKSLVSDPPTHLWVRRVHFAGLPYLVNLYQRVVLVATGSGICVFLSFLLQPCAAEVCVVWVTKGVEENFGTEIKEMMSGFPEDKVIVHDTAVLGRPNVAAMSVDAAKMWNAEAVIVTSNPEGSRDVVEACEAAGIAAFGPIWDS